MTLVILAGVCFVSGVALTPIKLREIITEREPRLLPSTFFTCCACLGFTAVMFGHGEHVVFWGAVAALSGGFLGSVASLFSIPILPRWQWMIQLVTSASVFVVVIADLLA